MSTAERVRLPDDCTVGYIVEGLLGARLLHSSLFHSHLESLQRLPPDTVLQQVRRWVLPGISAAVPVVETLPPTLLAKGPGPDGLPAEQGLRRDSHVAGVGPSVGSGLGLLVPRVVGAPFSSGGLVVKDSCCGLPCGWAQDSWAVGSGPGVDRSHRPGHRQG